MVFSAAVRSREAIALVKMAARLAQDLHPRLIWS